MEIMVPDEFKRLYVRDDGNPIRKVPDPVLRETAKPVDKMTKKVQMLADDMVRIMRAANGIGLAAPQVGVSLRLIVIAPTGTKPEILINPVIVSSEGECVIEEGCLSIPGLYGDVIRPEKVVVEAYDRKGRPSTYEMEGMPARVVQHEIDHLDGVLFVDKADPATLYWSDPAHHVRDEA